MGKYGPFPAPGGACSGYMLEGGGAKLLIDCGSGTLSRFFSLSQLTDLDGILISHLHYDHISDLFILRYALEQLHTRGKDVPIPLLLLAPDKPDMEFRQLAASGVYNIVVIEDGMRAKIKDMTVTFHRLYHTVPSYAMDIDAEGRRLFYTGDTGSSDRITQLCNGADLLLADTCFLSGDKIPAYPAHLTAREAGVISKAANVRKLLCTHIWGGGYTDAQVLEEVKPVFPQAQVAVEMRSYQI